MKREDSSGEILIGASSENNDADDLAEMVSSIKIHGNASSVIVGDQFLVA